MKVLIFYYLAAGISLHSVAANRLRTREAKEAPEVQAKIVGGTRAQAEPYFGILNLIGCGASLIHDDIMLSAAHCRPYRIDRFKASVYIGGAGLKTGLPRYAVDMIKHPSYSDYPVTTYDFMIIKLNASALQDPNWKFGDEDGNGGDDDDIWGDWGVDDAPTEEDPGNDEFDGDDDIWWNDTTPEKPVAVSAAEARQGGLVPAGISTGLQTISINRDASTPKNRDPLSVMGFGGTSSWSSGLTDHIYTAEVFFLDDDRCEAAYADTREYDPDSMMCAGHPNGGIDTCSGDSGGPMVDGEGVQVGVVSWGEGCGDRDFPGVYAQVDAVAEWIEEEICKNSCNPPDTCDPSIRHACANTTGTGATFAGPLEGPVNFTIKATLDGYPSEFGVMLTHTDSQTQFWFATYGTFSGAYRETKIKTFTNLPAGIYQLFIGDSAADGIGSEGGVLVESASGEALWGTGGRYDSSAEVYMNFSSSGELVWAANHINGTIDDGWQWPTHFLGEWNPEEHDAEWPGTYPLPVNTANVVTLNFRTDRYPTYVTWEWSERVGPDTFETWDKGTPERKNSLYSYEKRVKSDTIYKLTIHGSSYYSERLKWFTVTSAMASGDQDGTVIWKIRPDQIPHDGYNDLEIFFWVDSAGVPQQVVHIDGVEGVGYALAEYTMVSEARTIVVSEKPKEQTNRVVPGE